MENLTENKVSFDSKYFDLLLKLPLGIVGLFYILGIFVHGFYYGRYHINSLNLFKLTYILAGFWATVYLLIPGVFFFFLLFILYKIARKSYAEFKQTKKIRTLLSNICLKCQNIDKSILIGYLIIGIVIFFGSPYMFATYNLNFNQLVIIGRIGQELNSNSEYFFSYNNLLLSIFLVSCLSLFLWISHFTFYKIKNVLLKLFVLIIVSWMFISILFSNIDEFSRLGFEKIPTFIGGGGLLPVTVIAKTDKNGVGSIANLTDQEVQKQLNANNDKEDVTIYLNCKLILDTDEGFYVQTDRRNVILLPKEKVLHIIFLSPPLIEPVH
jgi:hypothetical protein